jgi:hypothetical protein
MISYLRAILLRETDTSERAEAVALGVTTLCGLSGMEDTVIAAGMAAALFQVTKHFAVYKH